MKGVKVYSRNVVLSGTKLEITVPKDSNTVNIKSDTDVVYYEKGVSYTVDGITYGTGYTGRNMTFPVNGIKSFWLTGSGVATLLFTANGEL